MAKLEGLTEKLNKAQSIDFAEMFGKKMTTLQQMLGIERKLPMPVGSVIKTYKSKVVLKSGEVDKGDLIPLSQVELEDGDPIELKFSKHRKAVAAEDIQKYGFDRAVTLTDGELIKELQKDIRTKLLLNLLLLLELPRVRVFRGLWLKAGDLFKRFSKMMV